MPLSTKIPIVEDQTTMEEMLKTGSSKGKRKAMNFKTEMLYTNPEETITTMAHHRR